MVLFSAFSTVFGMFALNKLPQHYNPIFKSDYFRKATCHGFFIGIDSNENGYDREKLRSLLSDHQITLDMERSSSYSMILFALTLTFAAIDLVMSLTPHWYSTIFGVYIFAGSVLIAYCFTSLLYMYLRKKNYLKDIVTVEHYHDLGKLIYGFNIFWSYIAFCQFFLIWYANVPEETEFYLKHFEANPSNIEPFYLLLIILDLDRLPIILVFYHIQ